jgi:hypothetical protein
MHLADALLEVEGLGVREEVVDLAGRVLEAELDVVQPGCLQRRSALFGEADAGGEQVGVVAQAVRLGDEQLEVVAQQRFAAGEAALHRARAHAPRAARFSQASVPISAPWRAKSTGL